VPRVADPARPDAILDAARAIFLRDGYADTRMVDIAAEAGVAVGTLYLYFDSKEALVRALAEQFFGEMMASALPALECVEQPCDLDSFVRRVLAFARSGRDLLRLVHPVLDGVEPGCRPAERKRALLSARLVPLLRAKIEAGVLRPYDPEVLADLLITVMQAAIRRAVHTPEPDAEAERYQAGVIAFLQSALLPT
jgi:TetR/AcrR family fatty acid metabolism transcriptional regulator